jgi:hypothetical protein
MTYQEHFLRLREPPECDRSFSHVWAMDVNLEIISGQERMPVSVKPRDVSSTKASIRRLWWMAGVENDIRSGIMLSSVCMSRTTRANQAAPGTEERLENCSLVVFVGDAIYRFDRIFHELEGLSMGSNCVGWHTASAGCEHGQGNYNPVVTSTGVVIEHCDVGLAYVT